MEKIKTVKMVRDIRDRIYKKTRNMKRKEMINYYHTAAENVHERLGLHER